MSMCAIKCLMLPGSGNWVFELVATTKQEAVFHVYDFLGNKYNLLVSGFPGFAIKMHVNQSPALNDQRIIKLCFSWSEHGLTLCAAKRCKGSEIETTSALAVFKAASFLCFSVTTCDQTFCQESTRSQAIPPPAAAPLSRPLPLPPPR